jgi:sugar/nucleoside kinase (ribokinase family)
MGQPRRARAGRRAGWRLVFLGDLTLDVVLRPDRRLAPGTDVPGHVALRAGGSAANAARWAARLGARSSFVGAVGRDGVAGRLATALRTDRVTPHLIRVPGRTARIGVVVEHGERSFVADRGAADQLPPESLRARWFVADALHLPAYSLLSDSLFAASLRAVELARANGALVSVDLASRGPLLSHGRREVVRRLERVEPDLLLGNEPEVAVIAAARGPRALLELAAVVCVKRGAEGCTVWARPDGGSTAPLSLEVRAGRLPAEDPTGAGDAFDAGFLLAWLDARAAGARLPTALRRAALAGNRAAARHLSRRRRELPL